MSTFLDLYAQIAGQLPGLGPFLSQTFVNQAWVDIGNKRLWNFLQQDVAIVCPAQITSGSVSFTQFDNPGEVTCDATASAALLTQATPGATQPGLTNMQIRFSTSSPSTGQVYSIVAADVTDPAAIVLTLDRMIVEPTDAESSYQVYRCYFVPPLATGSFRKWVSVVDMVNGWQLKLDYSSAYFDARDPQRQAQGQAYYIGSYEPNYIADAATGATAPNVNENAGTPNFELWPHPTGGQTLYARARTKASKFVRPTDEIPNNIIEDQLILEWAKERYAYPHCKANVAHFPAFKGANWESLVDTARRTAAELLNDAKRNDDEQGLSSVWNRGHGLRNRLMGGKGMQQFPIDSNFLQSHLVRF